MVGRSIRARVEPIAYNPRGFSSVYECNDLLRLHVFKTKINARTGSFDASSQTQTRKPGSTEKTCTAAAVLGNHGDHSHPTAGRHHALVRVASSTCPQEAEGHLHRSGGLVSTASSSPVLHLEGRRFSSRGRARSLGLAM